jgi:hypothetical protein
VSDRKWVFQSVSGTLHRTLTHPLIYLHICCIDMKGINVFSNQTDYRSLCLLYRLFSFLKIVIILLLYWGYTVTFTKVLIIYHSLIHPLHHSPLSSPTPFLDSFIRSHFSIFIHEYIIFIPYESSYTLSLYTPTHWFQLPDRTCSVFLSSIFEKRHFCLFKMSLGSFIMTLPCICILYPELVHSFHFSFYLSSLLMVK